MGPVFVGIPMPDKASKPAGERTKRYYFGREDKTNLAAATLDHLVEIPNVFGISIVFQ